MLINMEEKEALEHFLPIAKVCKTLVLFYEFEVGVFVRNNWIN
jgi:hypothetical protein